MTTNLPANIANMAVGLAQSVQTVSTGSGDFMKMNRSGEFVYGREDIEVEEGSIWAVNPAGFQHGHVAWGDKTHGTEGKHLGEHMGPAHEPIYPESDLGAVEGEWHQAIGIQLACTDGEDVGQQCLFKSNSVGGRKGYGALLEEVVEKIKEGTGEVVPLVRLNSTHYKHDKYGKIFTPDFIIVGWTTMDATAAPEEEKAEEPEPEPEAPKKRTRKAKAKQEETPEPEPEPAPQGRSRRRRKSS